MKRFIIINKATYEKPRRHNSDGLFRFAESWERRGREVGQIAPQAPV